jgi:metallo-beta-lactamase family protein
MESVYGDRLHEGRDERVDALRNAIESTREKQGTLLIPSFSLERTQVLLFEIDKLIEGGMQPIPVYLDSPLAIRATDVFRKYPDLLNADAQAHFHDGHDPFTFKNLHVIHSTGESRDIHKVSGAKVIIAGAGMSSGGRIRAHEMQYLPDPNASVLFVGYQAPGSLGRRIQDGAKSVLIDGTTVPIRATIDSLGGYSGHADRDGLLNFVEKAVTTEDGSPAQLERVFVVMGEPRAELFIAQRIHDFLGVEAHVPAQGEVVDINF